MSKLSEYFKKPSGAFMCGCLVAVLGTGAIDRVKAELADVFGPSMDQAIQDSERASREVVLPRDNSAEIKEYQLAKKEFDKVKNASDALVYENDMLLKSIDSLVGLYDELEAVHYALNDRATPQVEVKLLAGVAMDWLAHHKGTMGEMIPDEAKQQVVPSIPASATLGSMSLQRQITPSEDRYGWMRSAPVYKFLDNKIDYKVEASRIREELGNLKETVAVFSKDNSELRETLFTMLKQLDVIYSSSVATNMDLDAVATAIDKYADTVNKYVEDNRPAEKQEVAKVDDIGNLIREMDEAMPSNSAKP
ncbi:hypothetical protein [Mesorhizobium sp. SP-1A]|uniref:hypothetical protein n=1 Tax=Mesorhizobium sp. SP-1A TaxID=3077840 RepID=UPI0028F6E175|nr:hypothetical protein [Mesorhizobium sp. SP-1A]